MASLDASATSRVDIGHHDVVMKLHYSAIDVDLAEVRKLGKQLPRCLEYISHAGFIGDGPDTKKMLRKHRWVIVLKVMNHQTRPCH